MMALTRRAHPQQPVITLRHVDHGFQLLERDEFDDGTAGAEPLAHFGVFGRDGAVERRPDRTALQVVADALDFRPETVDASLPGAKLIERVVELLLAEHAGSGQLARPLVVAFGQVPARLGLLDLRPRRPERQLETARVQAHQHVPFVHPVARAHRTLDDLARNLARYAADKRGLDRARERQPPLNAVLARLCVADRAGTRLGARDRR